MTDDREPHIACTRFISENDPDKKLIQTEFETPEQWYYAVLLARLADEDNGFGIPAAGDKLELIAETMISYKRQGRLENVVSLVGSNTPPGTVIPVGSRPMDAIPITVQQLPGQGQAAPVKKKKWGLFSGRNKQS
jgi:hypothetical protein